MREGKLQFVLGFAACAALNMAIQDWMGLEGYIEHIQKPGMWLDLPWWVGGFVVVLVTWASFLLDGAKTRELSARDGDADEDKRDGPATRGR